MSDARKSAKTYVSTCPQCGSDLIVVMKFPLVVRCSAGCGELDRRVPTWRVKDAAE